MTVRAAVLIAVGLAILPLLGVSLADAQSNPRPARIGLLKAPDDPSPAGPSPHTVVALKEGLAEHGYVEGRNLVIEYRHPRKATERVEDLAAELVRLSVDVIHAAGPTALRAARATTTTIPIVAHDFETDPVASGLIASYARPGGNVTGTFLDLPEVAGKWLELLRQVVPKLARVAILWDPTSGDAQLRVVEGAARALRLAVQVLEARDRGEIEARFRAAVEARAGGVVVLSSPLFSGGGSKHLAELAVRHRLPSVSLFQIYAEAGGLLAYGPDNLALYRQEGRFIGKILAGARPADLPIERPARFELLVNMKTAKRLGVTVPSEVMLRADRVIE